MSCKDTRVPRASGPKALTEMSLLTYSTVVHDRHQWQEFSRRGWAAKLCVALASTAMNIGIGFHMCSKIESAAMQFKLRLAVLDLGLVLVHLNPDICRPLDPWSLRWLWLTLKGGVVLKVIRRTT